MCARHWTFNQQSPVGTAAVSENTKYCFYYVKTEAIHIFFMPKPEMHR